PDDSTHRLQQPALELEAKPVAPFTLAQMERARLPVRAQGGGSARGIQLQRERHDEIGTGLRIARSDHVRARPRAVLLHLQRKYLLTLPRCDHRRVRIE